MNTTTIMITGMSIKYSLDVTVDRVLRVYSGKHAKCMCGCAGRYWSPKVNAEAAGKDRGYELEPRDVNDQQVQHILNILALAPKVEQDAEYPNILHTTVNNRDYVVYLMERPS